MKSIVLPTLLLSSLSLTYGRNDWAKPCFDGTCSYDSSAGSLRIWGATKAISDITTAGGWTILNCNPNTLVQDIRLVCTDTSKCNHLYKGAGAVNTLVRLPNGCSQAAFARVARIWTHKDQSLPEVIAKQVSKRQTSPEVKGIALDQDFAAVDPTVTGDVNIEITGSNVPGAIGDANVTPAAVRRSRISRGLFDFIEDAFDKFNSFDKEITQELPPIDISRTFDILPKQSISCPATGNIPAITASLQADVVTNAHAVVTLGVVASGKIIPPQIDEFGLFAGLDATLDATLELLGSATVAADTGKVQLFEVGIPGLDFPGILTVGPSFKVFGQAKASLDVNVDMRVGLSYTIDDAKLFFPKSANHQSGGTFNPADTPLKLSVTPSVQSNAVVEAHVIPTLDVGISALGNLAKATVSLNLDAGATATLSLTAQGQADGSITPSGDTTGSASASVNGCFDVTAGLDVNAAADASFFGLFDRGTSVSLFSRDFDVFQRCFGASTGTRRSLPQPSKRMNVFEKRFELQCPTSAAAVVAAVDESVSGGSIKGV